jgi:hypothetical protein
MKIIKILSAILFSLLFGATFAVAGAIIGINPVALGITGTIISLIPTPSGVLGIKIGTLTTGAAVVTTFDLPYTPEFIKYTAATQLTGLRVEVYGQGVTIDLDATGLTALGKHRVMSIATNMYRIPVADGILKNKPCKLSFTNSAAQTPDIMVSGDNDGAFLIKAEKATVLLNTNSTFDNFAALFCPSLAAGDKVTTLYEDGLSQIDERDDLEGYAIMLQYTPAYYIDNLRGDVKNVSILVAATQTVYVVRVVEA